MHCCPWKLSRRPWSSTTLRVAASERRLKIRQLPEIELARDNAQLHAVKAIVHSGVENLPASSSPGKPALKNSSSSCHPAQHLRRDTILTGSPRKNRSQFVHRHIGHLAACLTTAATDVRSHDRTRQRPQRMSDRQVAPPGPSHRAHSAVGHSSPLASAQQDRSGRLCAMLMTTAPSRSIANRSPFRDASSPFRQRSRRRRAASFASALR